MYICKHCRQHRNSSDDYFLFIIEHYILKIKTEGRARKRDDSFLLTRLLLCTRESRSNARFIFLQQLLNSTSGIGRRRLLFARDVLD